jgi:3-oxoacyl-[acyl-carrier protein] reductase
MFQGKTAIVTGSARGIGQAIALDLASKGADLVICDVKAEWLGETAAALQEIGAKVTCKELDVTSTAACQTVFNEIAEENGRIDILVNNAGITRDGLLMRMSEEDWDAVLTVNLKGTFNCTKAVTRVPVRSSTSHRS